MTQIVLNVNDVSLLPSLKQILGAIKGVTIDRMVATDEAEDVQMRFITETITTGYQEAKEGKFAGKSLASLDDFIADWRNDIVLWPTTLIICNMS